MDEKIKDKIRKLLALGNSNNSDHESYAAIQKAQALMAEYKLSEKDLADKENKGCIKMKTGFSYGTRSSDHYLNTLADIIAENFCCVHYLSTPRGSRTHYICFMGLEEDVDIAVEALHTANHAIIRGYNRVYNDLCKQFDISYVPAKYFNPAKLGYIEGYVDGLKKALASQKEQNQEWGLVLVVPEEATNFLKNLRSVDYNNSTPIDLSYYDEGFKDGSNFNMHKKIDTQGNMMIE